jgi:hypothetical protein
MGRHNAKCGDQSVTASTTGTALSTVAARRTIKPRTGLGLQVQAVMPEAAQASKTQVCQEQHRAISPWQAVAATAAVGACAAGSGLTVCYSLDSQRRGLHGWRRTIRTGAAIRSMQQGPGR